MAWGAYNLGDLEASFRLAGASARLEREFGVGLAGVSRDFVDIPSPTDLREKHPEREADWQAGEAMDFKEAVRYALEWGRTSGKAASGGAASGTGEATG
jgi:hypothetical protein